VRKTMRFAQVALVAVVAVMTMGAGDNNKRFEKLGHQIMCTCGCNQVLLECNHVGCQSSGEMRDELTAALAGGSIAGGIDGTGGPSGPGGGGPGGGGNDGAPKDGSSGGGSNSDSAILNAKEEEMNEKMIKKTIKIKFGVEKSYEIKK